MQINKIYNYSPYFSQSIKREPKLTKQDEMNLLVSKVQEVFSQIAEKQVPENGPFSNVFITMDIPQSQNKGLLSVEPSSKDKNTLRNLLLGVRHKNSDRLFSTYLLQDASKTDILKYIQDENHRAEIINSLNELAEKNDKFYSSL